MKDEANDQAQPAILVASDLVTDAETVAQLLRDEYKNVVESTNPDHAVEDFEAAAPDLLVLAFNALDKAEHYALVLNKMSDFARSHRYRTILLCEGKMVRKAYRLCKKKLFDDYVVFWPIGHDTTRLLMSTHLALMAQMAPALEEPKAIDFAKQAKALSRAGETLGKLSGHGTQQIRGAETVVAEARAAIAREFEQFQQAMTTGAGEATPEMESMLKTLLAQLQSLKDHSENQVGGIATKMQPLRQWGEQLDQEVSQTNESLQDMSSLAAQVKARVLVIDDDEFQVRLLDRQLKDLAVELHGATSMNEALQLMRDLTPDLVLMDIEMPGTDGIEGLSQLKQVQRLATVPIIMISGRKDRSSVKACIAGGAADYLLKPISKAALEEKVAKAVGL